MTSRQLTRPRAKSPQWQVVVWLTVVWILLWGRLSVGIVVGGAVVATLVCLVFPLPSLRLQVRIRPVRLAWLVLHFAGDVVVASFQVARTTLRFGRQPVNAVIEVDLHTESDFVLTVVAEMVSLVPGSLVVEARAATHTLFLHVLDVGDRAGAEAFRHQVFALERRVVLALGADVAPVTGSSPADRTGEERWS